MWNLRLPHFVVLVVGTGFATGLLNRRGSWNGALAEPWFNPPNWAFAPVWSMVYLLVAIVGWRTWERDRNSTAMTLWWAQMALYVDAHLLYGALAAVAPAVILLLLAPILAFIAWQWSDDRISAALFIPYAAWVGFASILNFEIVRLN